MASEVAVVESSAERVKLSPPDGVRMTSESIVQVVAALNKAQHEIKEAKRNLIGHMPTRDGGYDYPYAGSDETYKATRDAQYNNGLALFRRKEGDALRVLLLHSSGEWLDFGLFPLGNCGTHQQLGGAMTYMCRYVEGLVFKLAPEDDDGNAAGDALGRGRESQRPPQQQRAPERRPAGEQRRSNSTSPRTGRNPHETVRAFAPPPHWPESSAEQLQNWVSGLKSPADFRAALGLFQSEAILMSDFAKWEPVCRHLHYVYHAALSKVDESRRTACEELTKHIDEAFEKLEADLASDRQAVSPKKLSPEFEAMKAKMKGLPVEKIVEMIGYAKTVEQLEVCVDGPEGGVAHSDAQAWKAVLDAIKARYQSLADERTIQRDSTFEAKMKAHRQKNDLDLEFAVTEQKWEQEATGKANEPATSTEEQQSAKQG